MYNSEDFGTPRRMARGGRSSRGPPRKRFKKTPSVVNRARLLQPISLAPELKVVDNNDGGSAPLSAAISSTPVFITCNSIALGSEIYNRIGRKVMMKSLHIRGQVTPTSGLSAKNDYIRVIAFYDKQPPTTTLAPLLTSADTGGNASSTAWDFTNSANFERYEILMDIKLSCPPRTDAGTESSNGSNAVTDYKGEYNIDRYIKLRGLTAHYDAAGAGTTPVTGALYVMWVGIVPSASSPTYTMNLMTRLRYHDF